MIAEIQGRIILRAIEPECTGTREPACITLAPRVRESIFRGVVIIYVFCLEPGNRWICRELQRIIETRGQFGYECPPVICPDEVLVIALGNTRDIIRWQSKAR